METKELMQFDWVCLEDDSTPRQVDFIRTGEVGLYWNKIVTPPYIKPIPLTPEILEKNGFTEIKGACPTFKIDIYGYLIKVTFPKENKETNKGNPFLVIDSRPSYYSSECLYVHELQHVLKLLGIKKEIEL